MPEEITAQKPVLILGAGITGLVTAWKLAKAGRQVTLIEKADYPGGLSATIEWDGFYFDHGGHNFFTRDAGILALYENLLPGKFMERERRFKLLIFGKLLKFPFLGTNLLTALNPPDLIRTSIPFLFARLRGFFFGLRETRHLDEWIIARYGRALYNIYFKNYLMRVQKCDPHHLSSAIGEKKIAVTSIRKLLVVFYHQLRGRKVTQTLTKASYYCRRGYGTIPMFFFNELLSLPNFTYRGGEAIVSISAGQNQIETITTSKEVIDTTGSDVISTIPLESLLRFGGGEHKPLESLVQRLEYVGMRFLLVKVKKSDITGCWFVNFNDARMPFYRITEENSGTFEMVPEGYSSLIFEIPVNPEDTLATMSDAELLPLLVNEFSRIFPLDIADVEGCRSLYADHANPRLIVEYQDILEEVFAFILSMKNLFSLGRQGLFTYANLDHCTRMALDFSDAYLAGNGAAGNRDLLNKHFRSGF